MTSRDEAWLRPAGVDPEEASELLLRDLHSSAKGLSSAEAQRRLTQYGPNELRRQGGRQWPGELGRQLSHPLALLLWLAAVLLLVVGSDVVAVAVVLIIVLNAAFAFVQERQAERAVEALAQFLPPQAMVVRDGVQTEIDATELVPGDLVAITEGSRIAADVRLLSGAIEADMSALTGESVPALRSAAIVDVDVPVLAAHDLVFSGTTCTGGEARGVVFATGRATELGRIASLSERVTQEPSPLEHQVRQVAWLIAGVSIVLVLAFIPLAVFGAGLSVINSVVFAAGLLAGMVPEGLLPVITLSLAVAVRALAARGALVKRLSAVETLGSTDVICTDKTGTLTENRMQPTAVWTTTQSVDLSTAETKPQTPPTTAALQAAGRIAAACNNARIQPDGKTTGDPTEKAVLLAAQALGSDPDAERREATRRWQYHFDPVLKMMTTIDDDGQGLRAHTKGAPEAVLPRCSALLDSHGTAHAPGRCRPLPHHRPSRCFRRRRTQSPRSRPTRSGPATPT
ncbi:HAD-IC family P-type ATPase [[Kitasatospora] papulosa]|uniref:HAD-IC family P-type ATPase n=1 Tax=[Kitasatospora] papulosa TaxID=1464011 RepID=UPI00362B7A56